MQDKKAASHIEMVISFTIFALFVFLLLIFLNPVRNQNIGDVLLDALERGIERNASLQLIEMPLNLRIAVEKCFYLPNPFETSNSRNIFVKDYSGKVVGSYLSGSDLNVEKSGQFFYLFFADALFNIVPVSPPCTQLNSADYTYAAPRTYELFFMPRLQVIKNRYVSDYNGLQEELNFPSQYSFIINITDSTTKQNVLSMSAKKPERIEVVAREVPIEILYDDGSIVKAIMNIQVW